MVEGDISERALHQTGSTQNEAFRDNTGCRGGVAAAVEDSYDYVIVGGGTAGLALATRLSQGLPDASILVIEAGSSALDEIRINAPGMRGSALNTVYDWNFTTVPQEALGGRRVDVNRGHVLGGSSAINYLCYDRASEAEYDSWTELGNPGWGWDVMLDAMVKSENFTAPSLDIHGDAGPIRGTYARKFPEALHSWLPTLESVGLPPSAGDNLEVVTDTRVLHVDFADKKCKGQLHATGVTLDDGTKIKAKREVILSAGSIGSPGLLENSGIGQTKVLEAAGVETLLDLPGVGENYQDHIRTSNVYRLVDGFDSFDAMIYDAGSEFAAEQVGLWLAGMPSWLDYTTSTYAFADWSRVVDDAAAVADLIALAEEAAGPNPHAIDRKKIQLLKDSSVPQLELIFENNYLGVKPYPGGKFITIFSTVMHPMSRGNVHIDPTDPHGKPLIDPRYLSNEHDIQAIIAGAKFARKVANALPMAETWDKEFEPGEEIQSEEDWRNFAKDATLSFFHPTSTCSMLPLEEGGVVSEKLIVHGTSNLRIVDASIIPLVLSAHTQTAVYGIAELAADFIIAEA
ncbi:unnamed protein product [Parascedosporium putredinis]|uniref:Glucose-methanol-choline oxidoreductase N-terminal domain-containing protein n=1 Tax=Parascedosporium putredinis TaxID=1442378 RepID=A0A9P1H2C7_9PEZI|nr:unnamed protein product [Parascedosporium putredinis]CAI7993556.1 unnamed protein product [Parascedosporium putredinis]